MQDVAPLHYAENLADLEELAKPLSVGKTKNSTPWHNALKTLYKSVFDENFDQEKCYIHCLRYLVTVQRMAKLGDEKFIRAMYKSDVVKVKQKMDEVKPVLEKRYQELQNLKRKPTATCTFKSTHSINIPRRKELFVDEFITCAQLYYSIQEKKNILLIDVRSENEFKNSKIIFNNIINISGDILVPGLSANVLTSQLSDDEAKQKWENRDMYEALVFMDWNTTSENISPKLNILKSAVVDWDYLKKYKQHPVILSGGFKDFFESYPASVTNVHINYIRRNEDIDELLELDSISYPDSNVSVMNLKEFTIEKLQVSFKTDELETVEEKLDDIADIQYPDLDQNTDNKEKENIVVPKGGEYVPEPFPDSEKEKEVEEIKEFKEDPSPSQEDKEETKMRLLTEARKLKRKVLGSDNKENIEPTSPIGDILVDNRKLPPPVRRETKPQELDLKKGWCGIYNIRNICYMSTIMQCLKCIPIIKKICDPKAISLMIKRRPSVILHEFVNMIFTLWEGTETDIKVTKPYPFYNTVCKLDDTYGKGRHEDCMEFFLFLLNHLNDDCSTEIITKSGVMIEREKAWYHYLQGRSSFWVDLFYHQFKCTKVCQICSTQAVTYETDNTLMLSVPHQTKYRRIKMKQLIQEYMEDNQIMDYKCSKCQEMKVINIKSVVVAPEILVIVLKRYYQDEYRDMKKNNIPVDFEKDLLFGGANYELCSVAQHMGTIDVGHYFAAGRVPDGWVQFNDERVTRFTDMGGLAVTACAFFYTKKGLCLQPEYRTNNPFSLFKPILSILFSYDVIVLEPLSKYLKSTRTTRKTKIAVDVEHFKPLTQIARQNGLTVETCIKREYCFKFITCNFHFSRYLSNYPQNVLKSIKNVSVDKIVKNVKEERKVPLKGLATVLTKIDFANLTSAEAISLLNCCGNAIPTASSKTRSQTCRLIYEYLVKHEKINLDIFHNYIKICNENLEPVDYQQCLKTFKLNPTKETYQLVLENVCEQGDIDQAYNILEAMRDREMSVNEDVFNSLVLGHVLQGGLSAAESILQTMKTAHIAETNATKMNLFKGLLRRKDYDDFKKCLHKYPIRLSDHEFLLMLEYIGVTGNLDLFKEVEFLFSNVVLTHELQVKVEDVCFYLIHMDQVKAAIQIYEKLVTFEVDRAYGEVILKEMLHCNTDINEIISIAKQIREDGKNKTILENLTGFALQHGYVEASWKLLNHIAVRCHYFWPLFILAGKSDGEKGVFSVIEKMKSFNLKPDAETLEVYIFPYCNLDSLKMLVSKFKKHDFTAKEVVSPLATLLLKKNMVKDAYGLCTSYNVNVANPDASNVLARAWKATYDSQTIVKLLKIYSESVDADNNLIQNFLVKSVEMCRSDKAYRNFLNLNEIIKSHNFRISFPTGNNITQLLEKCPEEIKDKIKDVINSMLDVSHNMNVEETLIPHPRKMSTQQLECHLIELEEKNMETRGVLRRLIQMHSREGNVKRIGELRTKLQNLGYEESPGMKSLIMHNYVLAGQLDDALDLYSELKREHPEFILDSYKSIDLATLMVEKLRFEEALTMLEAECKKLNRINPENLVRNCRKLLMSCTKDDEQMMLFDLLLKAGLCRPTNIILGPLMRTYLIRDDLTAAVDKFTEFAQKYGCTPLQRELLSAVSKTQNSELLEKVLRATQKVHGAGPAQVGLIAALAESGQVKPLKKVLVQTNLVIKPLLERECKRWMEENNVAPLLALSQAGERLPNNVISLTFVYNCILEIYGNKNDINAISNFSDALPEDYIDKTKLEKKILYLLGKNNNVSNPKSLNVTL